MSSLSRATNPQSYAPETSPVLPALAGAPADLAFGGAGAFGMQGLMGNGAVQEALATSKKKSTKGTASPDDASTADRAQAAKDLANRFTVVADDYNGKKEPNTVTKSEYEKICATYSDVRLGKGDLTIDPSMLKTQKERDAYKAGALDDIASLLQTNAGRGEIFQLHDNATQKDSKGNPIHRHTTLNPLLLSSGKLDKTNGYAAPDGAGGDASYSKDGKMTPGKGTDVHINYNPGINVGDAYKDYQSANPWLKGFRSDVILMHEGNHAMKMTAGTGDERLVQSTDNAKDKNDPKMAQDADSSINRIEHQAVGLGLYANDPMTENAYRAERRQMADDKAPGTNAGDSTMIRRTSYTPTPPAAAVAAPKSDPFADQKH